MLGLSSVNGNYWGFCGFFGILLLFELGFWGLEGGFWGFCCYVVEGLRWGSPSGATPAERERGCVLS